MNQPLGINFDFALGSPDLIISLSALATLHNSEPYYIIDNIRFSNAPDKDHHPVLPEFEIKKIPQEDGTTAWVHCDSEKESLLSIAAGKAIDKVLQEKEL